MTRTIWIAVASLILAGCQTMVADSACTAFTVIPYHGGADSPDTIQRIREHNAAYRAICGG